MLFIIALLAIVTLLILFFQKNQLQKNVVIDSELIKETKYDILEPKFTINSNDQKIAITANEGNFINDDEILLRNQVIFKSDQFEIHSDDVFFDKKKQTARSKNDSIFFSEGTKIHSQGFDIIEQGNIIQFNGKTLLTLTK